MLNIWLLYKAKCDVGERGQSMRHLQSTVWLFSGLGPPPSLWEDLGSSVWHMHLQAVPTTWGPTPHLFVAMFPVANHEHAHASVKADFAGVAGRPEAGFADPIPCKATGAVQTKPRCLRSHANDESSWNHVQDIPIITYHNPHILGYASPYAPTCPNGTFGSIRKCTTLHVVDLWRLVSSPWNIVWIMIPNYWRKTMEHKNA